MFSECVKPILQTCENICEQTGLKEGGIVVNSFGKLLKTLAVILAASSHRIRLEIYVCFNYKELLLS